MNDSVSDISLFRGRLASGLEEIRVAQVEQFLPVDKRNALFNAICKNKEAFSGIGASRDDAVSSMYLALDSRTTEQVIVDDISSAFEYFLKLFRQSLPHLFKILGIEPFPVEEIPLTIVNGLDGHLGIPHRDESGNRFVLSFLYYLHQEPKAFHGGDLEFYDADTSSPTGHKKDASARIVHQDNLLLAYASDTYHGITKVESDSDDFTKGRFAVVGFLGPFLSHRKYD